MTYLILTAAVGETFDDGQKWGKDEGTPLVKDGGNVSVGTCTGLFKITVNDQTMEWSRVSANASEAPEKWYTSMYIRGAIANNWDVQTTDASHLSYNETARTWISDDTFVCGTTSDEKLFKIYTDGTGWNDALVTEWGSGTGNKLILKNGGNITANCNGSFRVFVDDQTMTWQIVESN